MRGIIVTLVVVGIGVYAGSAAAKAPAVAVDPTPPDFKELLQILVKQQSLKLGSAVQHEGCVASETLGDYLATLVANGSDGEIHTLSGSCEIYDPKKSVLHPPRMFEMFWECHVKATTGDRKGVSPWHYELAVLIEQATRKMDPKTLACPGSP
jgi:hypothetical protein